MSSTIYFHGGAGSVTGSNFLLDTGGAKLLIDCGLRQGRDEDEARNWDPFGYDLKSISHLIITHAHIDHIGRIPKLVRDGFTGTILSTPATKALSEPLLRDALDILTNEAHKNRRPMLYEAHDITKAFGLWRTVAYHETVTLPDGLTLKLLDSGHILGSSMAQFSRGGKMLVFTGDLGGGNSPLLPSVEHLSGVDYLVVESVYGDKVRREDVDRRELLENVIEDSVARGGTLLIPAFSTERTQDLLFEIRTLMTERRVPQVPVYVDSPLARTITQVFLSNPNFFAPEIKERVLGGEDIFTSSGMHFVESVEESHALRDAPSPKIIIAGSGMGSGGRIRGHDTFVLPDPQSTVLIVGYQAAGSVGRRLLEGEKTIRLGRDTLPVKCTVTSVFGYSAHMDGEGLLEFVNKTSDTLREVFVVEGEPTAASFLAQRIRDYLGTKATTPEAGESATIEF